MAFLSCPASFSKMCAFKPRGPDLNMTLDKVFRSIEAFSQGAKSEKDFQGFSTVIDINSNKLGAP
jgi:hypothetical protein